MTGEGSLFDVPPAAIGRFRVLHQIGAGTCGPVFRAVDPESDTTVAIKLVTITLRPGGAGTLAEGLAALVSTLPRMTAAVTPLATGLHGHTPFLATSFAAGDSLDVALKQFGPAVLADVVERLRAIAAALDAAAARDVWHGALHPRDVIVSERDTALTGLGLWPLLAGLGERLPVRRPYRAPELSASEASAAGDQFAVAALAYEWITGRRAPSAFVPGDMVPVPGQWREGLGLVFGRALHADPGGRYESCQDFVDALARVAEQGQPGEALSEPPTPRSRRRERAAGAALPLDASPSDAAPGLPLQPAHEDTPPGSALEATIDDAGVTEDEPAVVTPPSHDRRASRRGEGDRPRDSLIAPTFASASARPDHEHAGSRAAGPLAVAGIAGLVLGLGIGYLVWGSGGNVAPAAAIEAPAEQPPEPLVIEDPQPVTGQPAPTPATGAGAAQQGGPAPPAAGSLLVRSTPSGATVFVDGERQGVTPLTVSSVAFGTRVVRVQRDGFTAEERRIALSADRPSRSVELRLQRSPAATAPAPAGPAGTATAATGALVIETRPAGAAVTVDGRPVGTTPVTLDGLTPGPHIVTMRLDGFRPVTATVQVVAGGQARAAASLTSVQEPR